MAKRILTKEQMDKKAGQSSTSPFMQINQSSSKGKDKTEKKVSFSAIEAMERTPDSIEILASITDRMDTKLDRREDQYRPRVYQGRNRGCGYRQNNYGARNRSYSQDQYQITIEEKEIIVTEVTTETIDPITEIIVDPEKGTVMEMAIYLTIDQITKETIEMKGMVIEVKIAVDQGTETGEIGVVPGNVPNPGANPKTDTIIEGRVGTIPEIGTGRNLDHLLV